MSEDLHNEIEAINSIYGDGTLIATDFEEVYSLQVSCFAFPLRLQFPPDYPSSPPVLVGTDTSGIDIRREDSHYAFEIFKSSLGRIFQPGQVCLFDVIEDVDARIQANIEAQAGNKIINPTLSQSSSVTVIESQPAFDDPPWILSDVITELKSVFIARVVSVTTPEQAKQYLQRLLSNDKKVRSATHNITAWRIKGENSVTFQDCDDDGETAAGGRVLHLMQLMDLWNVMVVITRWYGGHQLGPKRFSIINAVARDAFVKGNFVDEASSKKKGKR